MHTQRILRLVMAATVTGTVALSAVCAEDNEGTVRPAYCAGSWYPGKPAALTKTVDDLLAQASPPSIAGKPIAVIAPHAGYRFSAPVAAAGYRCLQGHTYKKVIALAFSKRSLSRANEEKQMRECCALAATAPVAFSSLIHHRNACCCAPNPKLNTSASLRLLALNRYH